MKSRLTIVDASAGCAKSATMNIAVPFQLPIYFGRAGERIGLSQRSLRATDRLQIIGQRVWQLDHLEQLVRTRERVMYGLRPALHMKRTGHF